MISAILLTVNLKGELLGQVRHTTEQSYTIDQSPVGSKYSDFVTRKILHTNRETQKCYKKVTIPENIVTSWACGDCPQWEKPSVWKDMLPEKRIDSHLRRYDEGFGFSFEFLDEK